MSNSILTTGLIANKPLKQLGTARNKNKKAFLNAKKVRAMRVALGRKIKQRSK